MLVFIIDAKKFDEQKLKDKNVELVYIFNNKRLYKKLEKEYKCVDLDRFGKIRNENFFPKIPPKRDFDTFLKGRLSIYGATKKKKFKYLKRHYRMVTRTHRDVEYKLVMSMAKNIAKREDNKKAIEFIDDNILKATAYILNLEYGRDVKNETKTLRNLLNFSKSLFSAYLYSLGFDIDEKRYGDIYPYTYFYNMAIYYSYNKYDVYKNSFKHYYLKVISRFFIEIIRKYNIKKELVRGVNECKDLGCW